MFVRVRFKVALIIRQFAAKHLKAFHEKVFVVLIRAPAVMVEKPQFERALDGLFLF